MSDETGKEREAKEKAEETHREWWDQANRDHYELDKASENDPKERMVFWIDQIEKIHQIYYKGLNSVVDEMNDGDHYSQQACINRQYRIQMITLYDSVLRMGSMAFLGYVEGKGFGGNLPEILDGLNASCSGDPIQRFSDNPFSMGHVKEFGKRYLDWALDYVNRWGIYNNVDWDAKPLKRSEVVRGKR